MLERIRFKNDEPVKADCGCTICAGDYYYNCRVDIVDEGKMRRVRYTTCTNDEHHASTLWKTLNNIGAIYVADEYIKTAEDYENEWADDRFDGGY